MGATDCIVEPFSPTELAARIRAALRRYLPLEPAELSELYLLGDLTIDYAERPVSVAGRSVHLTSTECELLIVLSANAGRVLLHDALLERVWGIGRRSDR